MRKFIASTTIAASVIGGGVGAIAFGPTIAGAQDDDTTTEETTETGSGLAGVLEGLVTDGTITQDQADAVADAIETAAKDGQLGHRGFGRNGFKHRGGSGGVGSVLEDLGLDATTIREGIAEGLTLGEIAEANGSSADAVADALVEKMNERLDAAVEAGRIDEAAAAERAADFETRADAIVNGEVQLGRRGHRGPRGHARGFGSGSHADTAEDAEGIST